MEKLLNTSNTGGNQNPKNSLLDLVKIVQHLENDIKTLKDDDSTFFETFKVRVRKYFYDLKTIYHEYRTERKIKDTDLKQITYIFNDFKVPKHDFVITIEITKLKTETNKIYGNRRIHIKNIKSGVIKIYKAGFESSNLWQDELKNDIKSNLFKWF